MQTARKICASEDHLPESITPSSQPARPTLRLHLTVDHAESTERFCAPFIDAMDEWMLEVQEI